MTAFVLKIIALTCMIIDHMGVVFPEFFPDYFRVIGRLAFPVYVYLIAEGCRHTRSMPKYLLRLGIFALVSQIPFDLAVHHKSLSEVSFITDTNVFYTLFLGVLSIYGYQKLKDMGMMKLLPRLIPLVAIGLAELLGTDYGGFGVLFIFLMFVIQGKKPRLAAMALCCCYEFHFVLPALALAIAERILGRVWFGQSLAPYLDMRWIMMLVVCLLSVPLAAMYNGQRGPAAKWWFYAAYPVHLLILAGVWRLMPLLGR